MKPLIGIVVCGFMDNRQFVANPYIQSVRYSGGLPLILPLVRSDTLLDQYVSLCSGFLFCGGGDITPLLFGQEPQNGNGQTSITVDLFQIRLMKRVLASRKPVLAICRGMQVLSVACGGTIWQDLSLARKYHQSHAAVPVPQRRQPSDPYRTRKPDPALRGTGSPCKQFPPPGCQYPRQRGIRNRPRFGRND